MEGEFGWALKQLWRGQHVTRAIWRGAGMWVGLQTPEAHSKMSQPYLFFKDFSGTLVPWCPTHADLLATDWTLAMAD